MSDVISVSPADTLLFKLQRNTVSKSTLKLTNISNDRVIFKVKTTQPSWYYVRPNQDVLDIGQSVEIVVVFIESECNRFLDLAEAGKPEKLDKHRFLVQSKTISQDEYDSILQATTPLKLEEFSKLWENNSKDEKRNIKLKVDFQYLEASNSSSNPPRSKIISENAETVRSKLSRSNESSNTAPESLKSAQEELEALRKKYDAVVEYTVHLTAERDTIVAQLEEAQKDLSREVAKRRGMSMDSSNTKSNSVKLERLKDKDSVGFSFIFMLLAVAISYLVGKYL